MPKKKTKEKDEEAKAPDYMAIKQALDMAENQIRLAKQLIFSNTYEHKAGFLKPADGKIVEGIFDGESMKGSDGKEYPVPTNYASKSKLVAGDALKLTIEDDGTFVYKQIGPVERKRLVGNLHESNGQFFISVESKNYQVLPASVTYFKVKEGDKVTIIVPKNEESAWAAVENIVP